MTVMHLILGVAGCKSERAFDRRERPVRVAALNLSR